MADDGAPDVNGVELYTPNDDAHAVATVVGLPQKKFYRQRAHSNPLSHHAFDVCVRRYWNDRAHSSSLPFMPRDSVLVGRTIPFSFNIGLLHVAVRNAPTWSIGRPTIRPCSGPMRPQPEWSSSTLVVDMEAFLVRPPPPPSPSAVS